MGTEALTEEYLSQYVGKSGTIRTGAATRWTRSPAPPPPRTL